MAKLFQNPLPFWLAVLVIVSISSFDSYMSVRVGRALGPVELNPLARYLINADSGDVSLLIGFKTFGTTAVLLACAAMRNKHYKYLGVVLTVLLAVQAIVLLSYAPYLFIRTSL